MSTSDERLQRIDTTLQSLVRDVNNLKSWTKVPDNFDGASIHERRDIGLIIREEMREALREFFSPKRIIVALTVTVGLVKALIDGLDIVMRMAG